MINPVLLTSFIYSENDSGVINNSANATDIYDTYSNLTFTQTCSAIVGAMIVLSLVWIYFVVLAWILEYKHMIAFRDVSFFKVLTFGRLEAAEVSGRQILTIWFFANFVLICVALGITKLLIYKIIEIVLTIYYNLVGG